MNERELIYETKYDYDVRGNCIAEDQYSTLIPNYNSHKYSICSHLET